MLENEARKAKTGKARREMIRDAATLRSGSDLEASPPSDDAQKMENRLKQVENKTRRAQRDAEDAASKANDAQRRAREAEMWR